MIPSYLNNPDIMSGAAFFGLTLISGSKLVFALAVIRHLSQWWFLSKVEKYVLNRWEAYRVAPVTHYGNIQPAHAKIVW